MFDYPKYYFINSGSGNANTELVSFDHALISAGIADYNLLKVSSILPPKCIRSNSINVKHGAPLLVAYGTMSSNREGETISSAVGIGLPMNNDDVGIIMECAGAYSASNAERIVKQMVIDAMENHGIICKEVICSSIEKIIERSGEYSTVFSAVAMW